MFRYQAVAHPTRFSHALLSNRFVFDLFFSSLDEYSSFVRFRLLARIRHNGAAVYTAQFRLATWNWTVHPGGIPPYRPFPLLRSPGGLRYNPSRLHRQPVRQLSALFSVMKKSLT